MRCARATIVWTLACAGFAGAGFAGEHTHVVSNGESASSLARDYYGTFDLTELLLRFNAKRESNLRVGETVRIPYSEVHSVRPGDTGSALAQRYLGRPSAWPTIARLNDVASSAPLRVGQELVIPVALAHALARGETLAELAAKLYGEPSLGEVIADYNRIEDPRRLSVGTPLEIPLIAFRLQRPAHQAKPAPKPIVETVSKKPAATPAMKRVKEPVAERVAEPAVIAPKTAPAAAPPPPRQRFESQIEKARDAFRAGRFEDARSLLESLNERVERDGTDVDRSEFWALLAFVHVAFDREEAACEAYTRILLDEGGSTLDPDLVSPKIRRVLARCASPA